MAWSVFSTNGKGQTFVGQWVPNSMVGLRPILTVSPVPPVEIIEAIDEYIIKNFKDYQVDDETTP